MFPASMSDMADEPEAYLDGWSKFLVGRGGRMIKIRRTIQRFPDGWINLRIA
uniref:Uncharacterized protein n=1 Tax=Kalanchoe fedtschenkoi TaxID=63787 RepID=A0A7N0U9B6_KALFE